MNFLPAARAASNLIVSMGAGAVITNAVKSTTPADLKLAQKLTIGAGALVLSSMVGDAATKYTNSKIDEGAEAAKKAKETKTQSHNHDQIRTS